MFIPWWGPCQVWAERWDGELHYVDHPWLLNPPLHYLQYLSFHLQLGSTQTLNAETKRNFTIWTKRMGIYPPTPPLYMFKNGAVLMELKTASVKTKKRYKVKINLKIQWWIHKAFWSFPQNESTKHEMLIYTFSSHIYTAVVSHKTHSIFKKQVIFSLNRSTQLKMCLQVCFINLPSKYTCYT